MIAHSMLAAMQKGRSLHLLEEPAKPPHEVLARWFPAEESSILLGITETEGVYELLHGKEGLHHAWKGRASTRKRRASSEYLASTTQHGNVERALGLRLEFQGDEVAEEGS